jgi:hypothetical protein
MATESKKSVVGLLVGIVLFTVFGTAVSECCCRICNDANPIRHD